MLRGLTAPSPKAWPGTVDADDALDADNAFRVTPDHIDHRVWTAVHQRTEHRQCQILGFPRELLRTLEIVDTYERRVAASHGALPDPASRASSAEGSSLIASILLSMCEGGTALL